MKFKDAEFMTAHDKEMVLKQWERFMKALSTDTGEVEVDRHGNRMPKLFRSFTDRIYKHLSLHCSFIAHYSRAGFFGVYFEDPVNTVKIIKQFDARGPRISVEYGADYWYTGVEYTDLNDAMCQATTKYADQIYRMCGMVIEDTDVAEAKRLAGKHGYKLVEAQ